MNNLDKQYLDLVQDIINNGIEKKDRTGTGTKSLFGRQIRHKMSEGFPLLTTKKLHWKSIVTELIWFLRGETNIKYLVDNGVHIWDGDCYKAYLQKCEKLKYNTGDPNDLNWDLSIPKEPKIKPLPKEEFINKIKTDDEFSKKWGDLGPIYGKQWRNWGDYEYKGSTRTTTKSLDVIDVDWDQPVDQIANIINELKTNPDSRRMIVNAWNVGELDYMVLPPCHYEFQVYTRELSDKDRQKWVIDNIDWVKNSEDPEHEANKYLYRGEPKIYGDTVPTRAISLMWNQRSVDVGLGLPFNIASYGLLLEIIAKAVNMVPDELIGNLGDTHLYLNHVEPIKEQLTREPYPLPALSINTEFWPTESGECGVGLINALSLFNSFSDDYFCKCFLENDIQLVDYKSHPKINLPLSN